MLAGQFPLSHTNAISAHPTGCLSGPAGQVLHLLALCFLQVGQNLASIRVHVLIYLPRRNWGRALVKEPLSLIIIWLGKALLLLGLLESLQLIRRKSSNGRCRKLER